LHQREIQYGVKQMNWLSLTLQIALYFVLSIWIIQSNT